MTTEISGCINILIKPILAEDQLRASVGGCTEVLPWGVAAQSGLAGCCCLTPVLPGRLAWRRPTAGRSEEHTSELQSHVNLVCRLLLEKNYHICGKEFVALTHLSTIHPQGGP